VRNLICSTQPQNTQTANKTKQTITVCILYAAEDDIAGIVGRPPLPLVQLNPQNKQLDAVADDEGAFSLKLLLDEFGDRWQFSWIKERIQLMWPEINLAARHVTNATCTQPMPRLRVCL